MFTSAGAARSYYYIVFYSTNSRRFLSVVTRSQPNFKHGHEVTAEFWRSQIVTPVADLTTVGIGETTPCEKTLPT